MSRSLNGSNSMGSSMVNGPWGPNGQWEAMVNRNSPWVIDFQSIPIDQWEVKPKDYFAHFAFCPEFEKILDNP